MKNALEPISLISLFVVAILIEKAVDIPKLYLIGSGALLVTAVFAFVLFQSKRKASALRFFPWLYTCDATLPSKHTIRKIGIKAKGGSNIYVVSPDLYNDARSAETQRVVQSNLEREITYNYITRDDNDVSEANIIEVMHRFSRLKYRLNIFIINEVFALLPTRNVLVIEHDEANRLRVFVELPVVEQNVCNWWIEADDVIARQWHRKVLELLRGKTAMSHLY